MCGIVAYVGQQDALPIIIKGLKRLEYRGYDSAGVALLNETGLSVYKKKGKVSELENSLVNNGFLHSKIGIGHTRWATHGEPNDSNAHPHFSANEKFAMIHNGIIENYEVLKTDLINKQKTWNNKIMDDLVEKLGYMDYRDALAANKYILETKRHGDYH